MLNTESFKEVKGYEGKNYIYKSLHLNARIKENGLDISAMNVFEIMKFIIENIPDESDKAERYEITEIHISKRDYKNPQSGNYCFVVLRKLVLRKQNV